MSRHPFRSQPSPRSWFRLLVCLTAGILSLGAGPLSARVAPYLSETTYDWEMDQRVLPLWNRGDEGYLTTTSDQQIYYRRLMHPAPRAQVLIVPGQGESILNYRELAYDFYQQQFSVLLFDLRGHGRSRANRADSGVIHVHHFQDYIHDLQRIVATLLPHNNRPLFAFGQALGASILASYMAQETHPVQAAVLAAPLLDPQRSAPLWLARSLSSLLDRFGAAHRPFPLHRQMTPEQWTVQEATTSSLVRFVRYRQDHLKEGFFLSGVSSRWMREVIMASQQLQDSAQLKHLTVPSFLALAELDPDTDLAQIRRWCKSLSDCRIRFYPGARQQLWNERDTLRRVFLNDVFAFFQHKLIPPLQPSL